jgi:cellulose synthase/poly-beta-1,6-N-acetylglucosamine synthase-like glycosyltransferase
MNEYVENFQEPKNPADLTVIIPAYNEAKSIVDTILSVQKQSRPPKEILVVDDCSTDDTAGVATSCGVTVIRPVANTGSKAGAQTFALAFVETAFVMAIDADTILAPDAIEILLPVLEQDPNVAAACGFVLPRYVNSIWERGRYVEYLFAFSFFKQVQDHFGRPIISSGRFSAYPTERVRELGGWSNRTMAEDMDLTWTMYHHGYGVRFVDKAICYPIEPHNFDFMSKQLRRWSHGFIQNVRLHWRDLLHQKHLRIMIAVMLWDAILAGIAYLVVVPLLAVFLTPLAVLVYVIDIPAIAVPVLAKGYERGELGRAIVSLPAFVVLRIVNSLFLFRALYSEFVLGRSLAVYEKGH